MDGVTDGRTDGRTDVCVRIVFAKGTQILIIGEENTLPDRIDDTPDGIGVNRFPYQACNRTKTA